MADVRVKICGLSDSGGVNAATTAGAAYVGFVFFPKSPRNVSPELAAKLAQEVPAGVAKVGLVVNPSLPFLQDLCDMVPLDMIQLHGQETPEFVAEIRKNIGIPVIKAVGIRTRDDLTRARDYADVADQLLLDAKAPKGADLPGGNGLAFDWQLLRGVHLPIPWLLAGGLTPDNVAQAIALTGARQVDVSSGVENAPGIKDHDLIRRFIGNANG